MSVYPAGAKVQRRAEISEDGLYRYRLTRTWEPKEESLTFIGLNPSTADAEVDDPTIRRCVGFAQRFSFGGIVMLNLYAYRATRPADLWLAEDPVGPLNDERLRHALWNARWSSGSVVAAWGGKARPDRVEHVASMPGASTLQCLAQTVKGQPGHPLYLSGDSRLRPWSLV